MTPYEAYQHLVSIKDLATKDYEAASLLWMAYRRMYKRSKKLEFLMDKAREKEAALAARESSDV